MLHIGRIDELVVIQITDDKGAVTGQAQLTAETANLVTRRIMDAVKEIDAAKALDAKSAKSKKK
ncbi:MAG: hypothetical protein Q7U97_04200 [Rhodocyclaceae bacterium]|nr:hypothetical protein [Rhodocyclaceae bacterium]